jgi:hypothetical protein
MTLPPKALANKKKPLHIRTTEKYRGAGMNFPSLFSPLKVGPYRLEHRLPRRLREGLPLTPYNRKTFHGGEEAGFTGYPVHDEMAQA